MSIQYQDQGRAIFAYVDDRHVATITRQGEKFGFSVFGTPHVGAVNTEEEARSAVERHLA